MSHDPAGIYRERLDAHRSALARLEQSDARLAHARLGVFALAVAIALVVWRAEVSSWLLIAPAAAFLALAAKHDRVIRARDAAARAIAYYERGLRRIEDRWIGTGGEPGTRFRDADHPYADDLDLFGGGSVFELLSTARTADGEAELAGWLKSAAQPEVIRARQQAISELGREIALRERMAVAGQTTRISVDTSELRAWAGQAPARGLAALRIATYVQAIALTAGTLAMAVTGNTLALQVLLVVQFAARYFESTNLERILSVASDKARDLETLRELLSQIESAELGGARIPALRATLSQPVSASRAIGVLQRISERIAWRHSLPLIPLGLSTYGLLFAEWVLYVALVSASALVLFTPFLALAVERWRATHGRHVAAWIATLAEFEATVSLATYHFEHPQDPFPVVDIDSSPPVAVFDGTGLGHPLLAAGRMVRNDVRLISGTQLLVVSGSNMSGKSTLLRTVGVNAVLALAGAPVRAVSLRLSPLALGATLRIQDSLLEGRSRFFAEITRIRTLTDLARGPLPLLFLLDELLHGTNSHDRLIGSSGILRALLSHGAIGLITTHDLALTAIADTLAPRASNIHFEDFFEAGEMQFDYRARPGPVTRSNALALMRAVGLELEPDSPR